MHNLWVAATSMTRGERPGPCPIQGPDQLRHGTEEDPVREAFQNVTISGVAGACKAATDLLP